MAELIIPENIPQFQVVKFSKKEALEIITYLTALLADFPPTHGQDGAIPMVIIRKENRSEYRLSFTVER